MGKNVTHACAGCPVAHMLAAWSIGSMTSNSRHRLSARWSCGRELVNERGWELLEIVEGRLVARRPGTFSKKPVKVEIKLSSAESGGTIAEVRATTRALVATPGGVTRETIRSVCDDLA